MSHQKQKVVKYLLSKKQDEMVHREFPPHAGGKLPGFQAENEGQYDPHPAMQGFTRKQVAKLGEIDETKQRMVFGGLQTSLRWIRDSFKTIRETGEECYAPSGSLLAQIVFDKSKGEKSLEFDILKLSEHVDIVSESIAENLQGLVPVRWF
jgi:hypothetical protein